MGPQIAIRRHYSTARPLAGVAAELNHCLIELARVAIQTVAYAAGLLSEILEYLRPHGRRVAAPPDAPRITPRPIKPPPPEALPLLTEAIVGSTKHTIARVLGAPRSAVLEGLAVIEADAHRAYMQTDIWYYPLPRHGQMAMAVTFAGNIARNVEFFRAPGVDRLRARSAA
ncbi:MAG TPA: hypothetical protein VHY37_04340 [Tepidisphaeraceae bacterium]|jgi:hypothetical protein|nr:hypothetical protein [Tepidisphaeraceae bacterium]